MKASDLLIAKIKEFEGYSGTAYKDSANVYTCGYGHTSGVTKDTTCTKEQAEAWLREDLAVAEKYLSTLDEINTQGRFDACADFIYNLGIGSFKGSTLLKKIKAGAQTEEIQAQFRRWVYADGKVLPGLVRRREWEAQRWAETE